MRIALCCAAAMPSWPHTWPGHGGVFAILKLTPLDLAAAGFWQCIDQDDDSRYLVRRHVPATPIDEGRFVDPPAPFGSRHHERLTVSPRYVSRVPMTQASRTAG